jgi:site-specific DNA-methyltransferase (adenine-specific)
LKNIEPNTIRLSLWSPPYFVGKEYEKEETYDSWQTMLRKVIHLHFDILKPGSFMIINIADIMAFPDEEMPRFQGLNKTQQRVSITREDIIDVKIKYPNYNRNQIASMLGCSEQTIDRRMNGNNIRGGKHSVQTRVKLVGHLLEQYAYEVGLYLYDRRIWKKDPAWANCKWTTSTLKSVSEFEDIYVFWKPGEYEVKRDRLSEDEWKNWGYRQIWDIKSVRKNDDHEAKFPEELARRVIKLFSDPADIVLDPFMGSGTTAIAAIRNDRFFIGIEKEKKYVDVSELNIRNTLSQTKIDF